ncbi:hypothetical protein Scep_004409 [Stephania cephalantha]|uniref:Uncharacterized protein n=1 Tax=Stephania cephalantha TaxID=152367 RepID=A0AAP0KTB9_9MAGN
MKLSSPALPSTELKRPMQPISYLEEASSDATYVEMEELTSVVDYLSDKEKESGEELKSTFMTISHDCTNFNEKKVENEVEITFERLIELHKESKEDQPLVLVRPTTLVWTLRGRHVSLENSESVFEFTNSELILSVVLAPYLQVVKAYKIIAQLVGVSRGVWR